MNTKRRLKSKTIMLLSFFMVFVVTMMAQPTQEILAKNRDEKLRIANSPSITTMSLNSGKVGEPYLESIESDNDLDGNTVSFSISKGNLPAGLVLGKNGEISGTPSTVGEFTFSVKMDNSFNFFESDEREYTIKILNSNAIYFGDKFKEKSGTDNTLGIKTSFLPDAVEYVLYSSNIETYNAGENVVFELIKGSLPKGIYFRQNGEIYGIPSVTGTFSFTVGIKGTNITKEISLTIQESTDENVTEESDKGYEIIEKETNIPKIFNLDVESKQTYTITSKGEFSEFKDIYMNGKLLKRGRDYTASEGSTRAHINYGTIVKSSIGARVFTFQYVNETTRKVKKTAHRIEVVTNKSLKDKNSIAVKKKSGSKALEKKNISKKNVNKKIQVSTSKKVLKKKNNILNADSKEYIIELGDTLWDLSVLKYGTGLEWVKIMEANEGIIPEKLRVGRKIIIP